MSPREGWRTRGGSGHIHVEGEGGREGGREVDGHGAGGAADDGGVGREEAQGLVEEGDCEGEALQVGVVQPLQGGRGNRCAPSLLLALVLCRFAGGRRRGGGGGGGGGG